MHASMGIVGARACVLSGFGPHRIDRIGACARSRPPKLDRLTARGVSTARIDCMSVFPSDRTAHDAPMIPPHTLLTAPYRQPQARRRHALPHSLEAPRTVPAFAPRLPHASPTPPAIMARGVRRDETIAQVAMQSTAHAYHECSNTNFPRSQPLDRCSSA